MALRCQVLIYIIRFEVVVRANLLNGQRTQSDLGKGHYLEANKCSVFVGVGAAFSSNNPNGVYSRPVWHDRADHQDTIGINAGIQFFTGQSLPGKLILVNLVQVGF